jgi:hypothetical protein
MRHLIRLHAHAPAKPGIGAACNGCGVCCLSQPCPLGMLISRRRSGPCAAVAWDAAAARYRCGLIDARRPLRSALARRWIAAGRGCDSDATVG